MELSEPTRKGTLVDRRRAGHKIGADLARYFEGKVESGAADITAESDSLSAGSDVPSVVVAPHPAPPVDSPPDVTLDVVLRADGAIFIVGWANDANNTLVEIAFTFEKRHIFGPRSFARIRRADVENALGTGPVYRYGFWLFACDADFVPKNFAAGEKDGLILDLTFASGARASIRIQPKLIGPAVLRDTVMGYFFDAEYFGNKVVEAILSLEGGLGNAVVAYNKAISAAFTNGNSVERFGAGAVRYRLSVIVCLYGRHEYLFLQNALLAGSRSEDVEFIYVSNSPELAESLSREARISQKVYGLNQVLVSLPGNAGFGAANNVAAKAARSDRLVFVNPDVFPISPDWVKLHTEIVDNGRKEETRLFGVPLYYDDGSLMHGGMYFEIDQGLSITEAGIRRVPLFRVEHYGKGAPGWFNAFTASRPVPAVTGAFISIDREWFEKLGGFSEEYVFGHYEDADLCLKSLSGGVAAWMHDIRFWHLEGKGSVRLPLHEGGSIVNRWLFSRRWGHLIQSKILGSSPSHELLAKPGKVRASTHSVPRTSSGRSKARVAAEA